MHWLKNAANRAGLPAAADLKIGSAVSATIAWDMASRGLGMTEADLAGRVASSLGVLVANMDAASPRALTLVPERLARRYLIYPLREDDRTITIATADPMDMAVEQAISFASGRRAVFELATPHAIGDAINAGYSSDDAVEKLLSGVDAQIADSVRVVEDDDTRVITEVEIGSGPVVKLTSLIIRDAVVTGASDIHIEPGPKGGTVRYRIDGVMRVHLALPMGALTRVVSRIKVISQLDIADRMRPQDGRARVNVEGKDYDLRVSTVPTRSAEKAVIRILRSDTAKTLRSAGLPARELGLMQQLLGLKEGIVIVTGPTGSGKTTTLYAALREVVQRGVNITTVEDPIEYELSGITQMQVDPKRGVTFASALKAILRQDPDVIFVGEIRDLETAQVAVQAALTGHLVLATMHTNDALGAIARLHDLGVDRASIASSLRGSIAQRLLRRVCGECSRPATAPFTDEELRLSSTDGTLPTVRAVGCSACGNTGYRGRMPIIEVAVISSAMAELITTDSGVSALRRAAAAAGMRPLKEVALERVLAGETTLQEVERVVGEATEDSAKVVNTAVPSAEPAQSTAPVTTTGPRILFVDDDPVIRLVATKLLREAGYQVEVAHDGEQAFDRIRHGSPINLVITDLHMPRFGGAELLVEIRGSVTSAAVPVIVLTGSDEHDQEAALMDSGADDYIRKPIDPDRFVARIRAALRRANL